MDTADITDDIARYAAIMKEIKQRVGVIHHFETNWKAQSVVPLIETIGLQFRKIFELIAFASLAANRIQYSTTYRDFAKHWEAAKLVKNLRRINPKFYPTPVIEGPPGQPGVRNNLIARNGDYLTETELVSARGKCGTLMHSANPYGNGIDYGFYRPAFQTWAIKIINLLNIHQVHLLGDDGFYLFHMKEEGHDEVSWYRFQPKMTVEKEV